MVVLSGTVDLTLGAPDGLTKPAHGVMATRPTFWANALTEKPLKTPALLTPRAAKLTSLATPAAGCTWIR